MNRHVGPYRLACHAWAATSSASVDAATRLHGRPHAAHAIVFRIKPRDANHCRQLSVSISCRSNSTKLSVSSLLRSGITVFGGTISTGAVGRPAIS